MRKEKWYKRILNYPFTGSLCVLIIYIILCAILCVSVPPETKKQSTELIQIIHEEQTPFDAMNVNIQVHMRYQATGGGYTVIPLQNVKVTAYNNLVEQTNEQPNIGASNRKVFEGSVAVSRDILRDYKVKYGDILCLQKRNQCYFIEDTMNKRYDGKDGMHVDIFMYSKEEALKVNELDSAVVLQQQ